MSTKSNEALKRAQDRAKAKLVAEIAAERERLATVLADPLVAMNLFKRRQATRMRNLRDPNWGTERYFPAWYPGQTTEAYIKTFQALNCKQAYPRLAFVHRAGPAPFPINGTKT